jgi:flagellar hook-associated protein 1 FlgK
VKPEDLAPVDSSGANGNALKLASLANSASAGGIGGATFGDFFSQIAASAGRESASAQANSQTQQQAADQARALRDRISGVSLDEQATLLMQFQRGYQAAARLITTLNAMLDDTLNLIR